MSLDMWTSVSNCLYLFVVQLLSISFGIGMIFLLDNINHLKENPKGKILLNHAYPLVFCYTFIRSFINGMKFMFIMDYDLLASGKHLISLEELNIDCLEQNDGTVHFSFRLPFGISLTLSRDGSYNQVAPDYLTSRDLININF